MERAVIARVIFFYPWVKGSTSYAAHFVANHPVEAMIAQQIGSAGQAEPVASSARSRPTLRV
jgi:hypothetical protein